MHPQRSLKLLLAVATCLLCYIWLFDGQTIWLHLAVKRVQPNGSGTWLDYENKNMKWRGGGELLQYESKCCRFKFKHLLARLIG